MSDAPSVVLNARAVARTISRMADETLELNDGTDGLVLVGIQRRGVQIAERLADVIREREAVDLPRGALDITLYRDDLQTVGPRPVVGKTHLPVPSDGTVVVVVGFLAYRRLEGAYGEMKNLKPVEEFLKECAESSRDAFTHMALARYLFNEQDYQGAVRELDSALALDPSFWEARKFKGEILLKQGMREEALSAYQDLIPRLNVPYLKFQCSNCGFRPGDLQWQCPQCRSWDTIGLMDSTEVDKDAAASKTAPEDKP